MKWISIKFHVNALFTCNAHAWGTCKWLNETYFFIHDVCNWWRQYYWKLTPMKQHWFSQLLKKMHIYLGHVLYIIITEIHNLTWGIDIHVKSKEVFLTILLFWQLLNVWYQNDSCHSQTSILAIQSDKIIKSIEYLL